MASAPLRPEPPPGGAAGRRDGLARGLCAAALLLGLVRFVGLGRWSLWLDEVFTWGDAHRAFGDVDNPLGYLIVRGTVELVGDGPTEAALRLAPAVAGYLCVPLTAWAFRGLAGPRRAWLAALLVALSPWQVQWSQTARFYTMAQLLTLVGAGWALRGFHGRGAARWVPGLAALGAGVLFHSHAAVLAGAVALAALLLPPADLPEDRARVRRGLAVLAALGALAVPVLWSRFWVPYAAQKATVDPVAGLRHFLQATAASITPGLAALALGALLVARAGRDRAAAFVALVCALDLAFLGALSTRATVTAQYAFSVMPWVALLVAWPVGSAGHRDVPQERALRLGWAVAAALPLTAGLFLYFTVEHGQRARWREAVAYVEDLRAPTDLVAATPAVVPEFYLTGAVESDVRRTDAVVQLDQWGELRLETFAASGRRMWIIVRNDYLLEMDEPERARLERFLREDCRRMATFPVQATGRDLTVEVWGF